MRFKIETHDDIVLCRGIDTRGTFDVLYDAKERARMLSVEYKCTNLYISDLWFRFENGIEVPVVF